CHSTCRTSGVPWPSCTEAATPSPIPTSLRTPPRSCPAPLSGCTTTWVTSASCPRSSRRSTRCSCRAHDRADVRRVEELERRHRAGDHAHEGVLTGRALAHRGQHLRDIRRRGLHRCQLRRELEDRHRVLVTSPLVVGHRLVERTHAHERLVERCGERLRLTERGAHAPRGDSVLIV